MLLKNFHMLFAQQSNVAKLLNGNDFSSYIGMSIFGRDLQQGHYFGTGSSCCHVLVGGGDTAPTKDDYDMADWSIVGTDKLKAIQQTATYSKNYGATVNTQWINMSASPLTVKELGFCFKYSSSAQDKGGNVLLARKVLDTPVIIQPNETYTFTYNIRV